MPALAPMSFEASEMPGVIHVTAMLPPTRTGSRLCLSGRCKPKANGSRRRMAKNSQLSVMFIATLESSMHPAKDISDLLPEPPIAYNTENRENGQPLLVGLQMRATSITVEHAVS